MKFLVELDYSPEVLDSDAPKMLKNMLEWSIKGLKVYEVYSTMKLDNTSKEENEVMIMEDKKSNVKHGVRMVKDLTAKSTNNTERIISDHGKWKSYDDPSLVPQIEM